MRGPDTLLKAGFFKIVSSIVFFIITTSLDAKKPNAGFAPLVLSNTDTAECFNPEKATDSRFKLVFYPQFNFKNSRLDKMYLVQANINPALEISLWRGSLITSQVIFPVFNEYSSDENKVRPGFLTFSQQLKIPGNIHLLFTAGNFDHFRAGADLKLLKPLGESSSLYVQAGYTGWSVLFFDKWHHSDPNKLNWRAGFNHFIQSKRILINMNVSKFLANDIALRGEVIRYFKRSSVGFYIQTLRYDGYTLNGGFFIALALPQLKTINRRGSFTVSGADFFPVEYFARPYPQRGRYYRTSPAENSNYNFFNHLIIK